MMRSCWVVTKEPDGGTVLVNLENATIIFVKCDHGGKYGVAIRPGGGRLADDIPLTQFGLLEDAQKDLAKFVSFLGATPVKKL